MMMAEMEKNTCGGDVTNMNEIQLGAATYVVYRSFSGNRSIQDLVIDRVLKEKKENSTFDERHDDTV